MASILRINLLFRQGASISEAGLPRMTLSPRRVSELEVRKASRIATVESPTEVSRPFGVTLHGARLHSRGPIEHRAVCGPTPWAVRAEGANDAKFRHKREAWDSHPPNFVFIDGQPLGDASTSIFTIHGSMARGEIRDAYVRAHRRLCEVQIGEEAKGSTFLVSRGELDAICVRHGFKSAPLSTTGPRLAHICVSQLYSHTAR